MCDNIESCTALLDASNSNPYEILGYILDSNMEKIFRAELAAESRNSKRAPKPRKFVRSKQCLIHPDSMVRYGSGSELPKKLRVNAWKLESSKRLQDNINFHRSPSDYDAANFQFKYSALFGSVQNNNNVSSILSLPVYHRSKKFAVIKAKNELEKFMLELQTREITPEDYEKLLELDEKIKARTADRQKVSALPTRQLSVHAPEESEGDSKENENGEKESICVICMEKLEGGCFVKELPCGHVFHSQCITKWLTGNSQNCPVDQLPFTS